MVRKLLTHREGLVILAIILFSLIIALRNSAFLSLPNLFDILQGCIVMGILALGVVVVMISGGVDVSFTAIAAFSMYLTVKILVDSGFHGSIWVSFLLSAVIGIALGLVNALFISLFNLPTIIVTLGTSAIFRGFLLTFVGSSAYFSLPERIGITQFSRTNLAKVVAPNGAVYTLPVSFLILVALSIMIWYILKFTVLGRGIYALGGSKAAAERIGLKTQKIQFFVYGFMGFCAGIAGIVQSSIVRSASPVDLTGMEMNVIAAVVLGGASISGGSGSVLGTWLGLILFVMIKNSLVLAGIPSYWQRAMVGLVIILGTAITAFRSKAASE